MSLDCEVCYCQYEDPRVLSCGHTFCFSCVKKLNLNSKITCPTCRSVTNFSNIRVNYTLVQLIKEMGKGTYLPITKNSANNNLNNEKPVSKAPESQRKKEILNFPYETFESDNNSLKITSEGKNLRTSGDKEEINFRQRFQFSKNIPNPIPYVEIKDRYYPSKPIY